MNRARTRAPLRWAGSKRGLLTEIISSAPSRFGRYYEPFAGSASLFFALKPAAATLSDINPDLIQFYEQISSSARSVVTIASLMPRTSAFYYALRAVDPAKLESRWRAARFLYLNRNCFNGVYRVNRRGHFNVPWGRDAGQLPDLEVMLQAGVALKKARLEVSDFAKALQPVESGDLIYLDPPYSSTTRKAYGEYGYEGCFGSADIARLVDLVRELAGRGAYIMLSYSDHPSMTEPLMDWNRRQLRVRRNVAGFAAFRSEVDEVLLTNF